MKRRLLALLITCAACLAPQADEPKNHDLDVVTDESKVPPYELPPLLVSAEGRPITTPDEWFKVRRPQLMSLFANLIYGVVPVPESPLRITRTVLKTDPDFMGGRAVRKVVRLQFENTRGSADLQIVVFTPKGAGHPTPVFLQTSFSNTRDDGHDANPDRPGFLRNGMPLAEFLQRGFGLVVVPQGDLTRHNEIEFQKGIHPLFYHAGQSFPKAHEWGVIAATSWAASRALDYLETDPDVDAKRVAITGHSKMGKAALWAAAQDQRFALVVSAQSGCAGAALWKRNYGENMEKMVTRFPYWLCRNAWKFVRNEEDLPVDQHMLLACIAPRPLLVHSGTEDRWADPRGEYLSAFHAGDVYRLLGRTAPASEASPAADHPLLDSTLAYVNRTGGHSVDLADWRLFLDFASRHLK